MKEQLAASTQGDLDGTDLCSSRARQTIAGVGKLPLAGASRGATLQRWSALARVAHDDLSVARLVEAHYDAHAILAELASTPRRGLLGVWAARPEELSARRQDDGGWVLHGTKPFCSGAGEVDAALVVASTDSGPRLFVVAGSTLDRLRAQNDPGGFGWSPFGMAPTGSETVVFDELVLTEDDSLGPVRAYVERPGFFHGGCGVAACWWGGARSLLDQTVLSVGVRASQSALAAVGSASAAMQASWALLARSAAEIDEDPDDLVAANHRASILRCAVAQSCRQVIDCATRHLGTGPLSVSGPASRQLADLIMYLTQFHDESAVDLGRHLVEQCKPRRS